MTVASVLEMIVRDAFLDLPGFLPEGRLVLKLEGHSITGSIKIKPAIALVEAAEADGLAVPGRTTFVESSSGNMGVAMSSVCASKGYKFICVTDSCATRANIQMIRALGGQVLVVDRPDENGGYVGTRLELIRSLCDGNPDYLWLNQYAHPANAAAHARETAVEILRAVPEPDWLFVGVGTGGTLMGCAEAFRRLSPATRIVAVDPEGSVSFGGRPARRLIPGIGNSRRPELLVPELAHHVVTVKEMQTIETCRDIARRYGVLLGGSSGSVVAAVGLLSGAITGGQTVVAIAPDFGEKYLDTIYDDAWVHDHFSLSAAVDPPRIRAAE